eukprot:CAMPEP_0172166326 /NCGR_PEP_ID=MMETSP1050-20130122/8919_1 /TAXON_ID=233186 /ORGANISM="Cryptomonas curvata, Strain CCAP979/52" /LENGTH=1009 /DNA_ID=CAMNT_0012836923 /DNA_START=133 /DNA_END=3159 /DNA_ORIENTATION=+
MQSEKKATKYLKAKDIENIPQLRKESDTMIKQQFPNNSPLNDVYQIAAALIRAQINTMPSDTTILTFIEEERHLLKTKIPSELLNLARQHLRSKEGGSEQLKMKTPKSKVSESATSKWSKGTDKTEDDSEEDLAEMDFDLAIKKVMRDTEQQLQVKDKEENEAYILQRLKEAATKLTFEQIMALIKHHIKREEMIEMQHEAAHLIRQSVDSEFHEHLVSTHNNESANNILGSMHFKALLEAYYDLRPGASSNSYKEVQKAIETFGIGDKDKLFDVRKFSTKVQQARGNYEMIFGLVRGVRESIKPVQETAIEALRQIATVEPRMLEFALDKIQKIQRSTKDTSLEEVMLDIVDRYVQVEETVGAAKVNPQPDKKKGDKSVTANPAFQNGTAVQCQICGSEHSAKDCPQVKEALKQSAIKRGNLLPDQLGKDGKRRGARLDSDDEAQGDVCLICTKFDLCSSRRARNHTTQDCTRLPATVKKQLLESSETFEKADRTSRDSQKPSQRNVGAEQSYQSTPMVQNPYYEPSLHGSRYFQGNPHQQPLQPQVWHQQMQMRPESQQMFGSYRSGGSPQTPRSANVSYSMQNQGQMQGAMYDAETDDQSLREPRIVFAQDSRGIYTQPYSQSSTPSTIKSVRESSDPAAAHMAMKPSDQGMLPDSAAQNLTRSLGNYLTEAQEERVYQQSRSTKNAMTAHAISQPSHVAMTATIMTTELMQEETMLTQTGGNDQDSQIFAQTQSDVSNMSTQTEPEILGIGPRVPQTTQTLDGFMEGQELIGDPCGTIHTMQTGIKSCEMQQYANTLWLDLEQVSDQCDFTEGQELATVICSSGQLNDQKSEDETNQIGQSVTTIYYEDDTLQIQQQESSLATQGNLLTISFDVVGNSMRTVWMINEQGVKINNLYRSDAEVEEDYDDLPELISGNGSPEITPIENHDGMPEIMYELSETELREGMFRTNLRCYYDKQPAPNGPTKEKVQQWQEQTAQVHSVCESDDSKTEEKQDHNYRHGAEYW